MPLTLMCMTAHSFGFAQALTYNYAIILWANTSNTLDIYILYFQELSWFICHSCFFFKRIIRRVAVI